MDNVPVLSTVAERWNSLAKGQKISAGILGVCGLIALVLSVQRINAGIIDPFTVSKAKLESAREAIDKIDPSKRLEAESRRRDTDGDGISDYDEEKLFGTSPYLRDTDGDGSPDNTELALGENPNCAAGQACSSAAIDLSALASSTSPFFGIDANGGSANGLYAAFQRGINDGKSALVAQTGSTSTDLQPGLIRDAAEIRKVLAESGKVDIAFLDKLTDDQLLQMYDQASAEAARQKLQNETGITQPPLPSSGDSNNN